VEKELVCNSLQKIHGLDDWLLVGRVRRNAYEKLPKIVELHLSRHLLEEAIPEGVNDRRNPKISGINRSSKVILGVNLIV
jgi:hypothetical protein